MADKEPSKEIMESALGAVEVSKATGKIRKGVNEVTKSIERSEAKLVVYAKDVNPPEITMHIPLLCEEKGIPCVMVSSREELGAAAGLDVPTAAVAIVSEGDARNAIKEVTESIKKTKKSD